jgi:hypothetical protein
MGGRKYLLFFDGFAKPVSVALLPDFEFVVYGPVSTSRQTISISLLKDNSFKHAVRGVTPAVTRESRVMSINFQTTRLLEFFLSMAPFP